MARRGVIARFRNHLPVTDATPIVSLGEGDTPLIPCARLSARVGRGCEVFVKYEGLNPTCSFKDRGMTVAVSKAVERGTPDEERYGMRVGRNGRRLMNLFDPDGSRTELMEPGLAK